jgi:hypothetical protein
MGKNLLPIIWPYAFVLTLVLCGAAVMGLQKLASALPIPAPLYRIPIVIWLTCISTSTVIYLLAPPSPGLTIAYLVNWSLGLVACAVIWLALRIKSREPGTQPTRVERAVFNLIVVIGGAMCLVLGVATGRLLH